MKNPFKGRFKARYESGAIDSDGYRFAVRRTRNWQTAEDRYVIHHSLASLFSHDRDPYIINLENNELLRGNKHPGDAPYREGFYLASVPKKGKVITDR